MSKITRQKDVTEQYGVMEDWLILFAHELTKQGYLENLKPNIRRKHFNSIDEKMADIKERIGFDVVSKLTDELKDINKESGKSCDCGGGCCEIKTAEYKHPQEDVKKMANILSYINDMVVNEPDLCPATVISKCKDADDLGFSSLKIDEGKLKSYISDLLNDNKKPSSNEVKYQKREVEPISSNSGLDQADYYSHARPETF